MQKSSELFAYIIFLLYLCSKFYGKVSHVTDFRKAIALIPIIAPLGHIFVAVLFIFFTFLLLNICIYHFFVVPLHG